MIPIWSRVFACSKDHQATTIPEQIADRVDVRLTWRSLGSVPVRISGRLSPSFVCSHACRVPRWGRATGASLVVIARAWRGIPVLSGTVRDGVRRGSPFVDVHPAGPHARARIV